MNKKRRSDYSALKRRLFSLVLALADGAVIVVLLFRMISSGKLADSIVSLISRALRVDRINATRIYFYSFRNFLDVILAILAILLFLVFFRVFLNRLTGYLDEINRSLDSLAENTAAPIELSPELSAVEVRLKTLQQSMERREAKTLKANQRKNDLLIYSAHDIKTPLTSVLGYLILLDSSHALPPEERARYTAIALDKTRELDGMINELFEISRYNLNEIELEKSWVNVYDMLSEIREEHYPLLKESGKRAELAVDEKLRLFADADKLARVFNNVFKNAVLYSEAESAINISSCAKGDKAEIVFENSCPAISQSKLNRLFEQFYRGEQQSPAAPGSGLGLAISREIVLLHGGSISAESTESGIRFNIVLPLKD